MSGYIVNRPINYKPSKSLEIKNLSHAVVRMINIFNVRHVIGWSKIKDRIADMTVFMMLSDVNVSPTNI